TRSAEISDSCFWFEVTDGIAILEDDAGCNLTAGGTLAARRPNSYVAGRRTRITIAAIDQAIDDFAICRQKPENGCTSSGGFIGVGLLDKIPSSSARCRNRCRKRSGSGSAAASSGEMDCLPRSSA